MSYITDYQQQIADAQAAKIQHEADNAAEIDAEEAAIQDLIDQLHIPNSDFPMSNGVTLDREGDLNVLRSGGQEVSFDDIVAQEILDVLTLWLGAQMQASFKAKGSFKSQVPNKK